MTIKTLISKKEVDGCMVELHDYSNWKRNPLEYLAQIASLSRGQETSKDPKQLWRKLLIESYGNPSSCFEFLHISVEKNMRTLLTENRNIDILKLKISREVLQQNIYTFKLKIPIYMARQLMRHRHVSYCELSRRYYNGKVEVHLPKRLQKYKSCADNIIKDSIYWYERITEHGANKVPAELARLMLPTATMTEVWCQYTSDDDSWGNFVRLRTSDSTQEETRNVVKVMRDILYEFLKRKE